MPKALPLLLFIFLLGCSSLEQSAAPALSPTLADSAPGTLAPTPAQTNPPETAYPLPEQNPASSVEASPSLPAPTSTPLPPTLPPANVDLPTITPSPTLDVDNHIQLRIVVPGPMSKVISPIQFVAHIDPAYTGLTRIELIGEDGRELYRKVFVTYSNIGYYTRVEEKVTFELKGAAEMGRLQISTYDKKGSLLALNSVRLMLFSVGENQFGPLYPAKERLALRSPAAGDEISGGILLVEGEINPLNDTPLILELFDSEGQIVGSRLLQLAPADGKYQSFSATIPYQVASSVPARLDLRQSDDRISGLAYLYSLPLIIRP